MCGIAGYWDARGGAEAGIAAAMARRIRHRGPDDAGVWMDQALGLALAHRRLSIIDLSEAGRQPMHSAHGRFTVVFNGEIYNYPRLREALEQSGDAPAWRGHSDTETLLAGFEAWGVEGTVERCVGMFALAVWDAEQRELILVRDRLGEKPLYYGRQNGVFLFGSELKALRAHPAFAADIDRGAVALLMRHNCIPAPYSIYRDIWKLPPGTMLTLTSADQQPEPRAYWRVQDVVAQGLARPWSGSDEDAVDQLEALLREAVAGQMLSDVPLGAFLSGGVDSSSIVALMQAVSSKPVRTFTIGTQQADYNEAKHAKAVARHLGTEHTELYVTPEQALNVIPDLPGIYCEPFSDSSQIPTYLVSRMTREHVTVALSGDGGDEVFGGYNRHVSAPGLWRRISRLPLPLRRVMAGLLRLPGEAAWDRLFSVLDRVLPCRLRMATPGYKLHKLAGAMGASDRHALYRHFCTHWPNPEKLVIGGIEPPTWHDRREDWPRTDGFAHWMMAMDALTYLPDDILVKVDRAAMAVGLETRTPFLDHRVFEFAWSLPLELKIRQGQGKWILRQVLYRHVPRDLVDRPKMGFGIPLDTWLRGTLRDWAEELLGEGRLRREGFFHPQPIRRMWAEHCSGKRNWQYPLWDVLMFQAWREGHEQGGNRAWCPEEVKLDKDALHRQACL